jgi:hypothetical protein
MQDAAHDGQSIGALLKLLGVPAAGIDERYLRSDLLSHDSLQLTLTVYSLSIAVGIMCRVALAPPPQLLKPWTFWFSSLDIDNLLLPSYTNYSATQQT